MTDTNRVDIIQKIIRFILLYKYYNRFSLIYNILTLYYIIISEFVLRIITVVVTD